MDKVVEEMGQLTDIGLFPEKEDSTHEKPVADMGIDDKNSGEAVKKGGSFNMVKEELAALCHKQWSGWIRYLFELSTLSPQGNCIIPRSLYKRWYRQVNTNYRDLSEEEKDKDRRQADKFIQLLDGAQHAIK